MYCSVWTTEWHVFGSIVDDDILPHAFPTPSRDFEASQHARIARHVSSLHPTHASVANNNTVNNRAMGDSLRYCIIENTKREAERRCLKTVQLLDVTK